MNNTPDPIQSQPPGATRPEASANPPPSSQPGRCRLEPLCSAVNEGAHRARAAAEKAVPKVKTAVVVATYWLGYGVSYAAVFSYTIVKELAPPVLKAGCRDGASRGRKFAENLASETKAQPETPPVLQPPDTGPSGPTIQPGAA